MKLAVHHASFSTSGAIAPTLAATARAAEDIGCSTMTLMDHWFQMEPLGGPGEPMLEGYTTLGYLAAVTSRLRLGLLVTGVTYRHPGLLAKQVATLDVLTGGRAMLGLGAAWYEREHLGLGVPYPPVAERFERLEEALEICAQMWSDDDGPYAGAHYRLAETICVPQPISRPRPPVMIGGTGERKTLRLVARFADACNLAVGGPEELAHKLDVLRGHCEAVGRDPAAIEVTIIGSWDPHGDPEGFLRAMEPLARLGADTVFVGPDPADPAGSVLRLGDTVAERLGSLGR